LVRQTDGHVFTDHSVVILTTDGESEDVAGSTLVTECRSEALSRYEGFDKVSHHVNLRFLLLVLLFVFVQIRFLARSAAVGTDRGESAAAGVRGGGGGVRPSTSDMLSLAPDDRVVEQVEAVGDKLALEVSSLSGVQRPRL